MSSGCSKFSTLNAMNDKTKESFLVVPIIAVNCFCFKKMENLKIISNLLLKG